MYIRQANAKDVSRIAEILVFNNRINFYPIFGNEAYSFGELQVITVANEYLNDENAMKSTFVYDDGIVRGLIRIENKEVKKLFVDPFFQRRKIGDQLLSFAIEQYNVTHLWALEKNIRAIKFYERHGFYFTGEKVPEDGTTEYLLKMERQPSF